MTRRLTGSEAVLHGPSTVPLTPAAAKRLMGVLRVSEWPVAWAGKRVICVQRKRHPYDEWTEIALAGHIDPMNRGPRYRAVVQ